jgi:hypothetical protein
MWGGEWSRCPAASRVPFGRPRGRRTGHVAVKRAGGGKRLWLAWERGAHWGIRASCTAQGGQALGVPRLASPGEECTQTVGTHG